jgi:hypothetical protein
MKASATRSRRSKPTSRGNAVSPSRKAKAGLDPKFIAAAKASKKKFAPLFKRLAKT